MSTRAAALLFAVLCSAAPADALPIDTFSTPQQLVLVPGLEIVSSLARADEALGGRRELYSRDLIGISEQSITVGDGSLTFFQAGSTSVSDEQAVVWSAPVTQTLDLTGAGTFDRFLINVVSLDQGGTIVIRVSDTKGGLADWGVALTAGFSGELEVLFERPRSGSFRGIDLTSVRSLRLVGLLANAGGTLVIDSFSLGPVAATEPGGGALVALALALGAGAGVRRRRGAAGAGAAA